MVSGRDDTMVVLRFSHAQALIPMATLLGIDAAAAALPADRLYRYEKTPWRTAEVSPMAANVQWDVFVDDWDNVLVRMLHQERQVTFGHGCRAWGDTSYFYALNELETCLLRK